MAVVLAGCGGSNETPPTRYPTPIPPTPTPRSTPLPEVPDAPSLGDRARPIRLLFAVASDSDAQRAANTLQSRLQDELGLTVTVELVNETDVLKELCSGAPVAAWVSAFTYAAAQNACEVEPVLAVTRGRPPRLSVGTTVDLIARTNFSNPSQLQARILCRSREQDLLTSWVLPSLIMASQGVSLVSGVDGVKDYPDALSIGQALYQNECDAAALPPGEFDDLLDNLAVALSSEGQSVSTAALENTIQIISPAGDVSLSASADTLDGFGANVIPYEVLVFPPTSSIPETLRATITDLVYAYLKDRTGGVERLQALLGADGVIHVSADDYAAFITLLRSAKWDMTFIE